jgi:L-alanine-DL-glutamate epimerase-like enolase superfamily enzyme
VVVLKPALIGGLRRTLDLARTVAAAGKTPIVSHLLDGPVALAAYAELACAIGGPLAHGVGLHPGLGSYAPRPIPELDGHRLRPHRC